jgi:hypothetical protein
MLTTVGRPVSHPAHQTGRADFHFPTDFIADSRTSDTQRTPDPEDSQLQREGHMVIQDIGDALWYAHFRLRHDSGPSGSIAILQV